MNSTIYVTCKMLDKVYDKLDKLGKVDAVIYTINEFKKCASHPENIENERITRIFQRNPYGFSKRVYYLSGIASKMYTLMDPSSVYNRTRRYRNDQISLECINEFYKYAEIMHFRLKKEFAKIEEKATNKEMCEHIEKQFDTIANTFSKINELHRWLLLYY